MSLYITQQQKEEWEFKIAELKSINAKETLFSNGGILSIAIINERKEFYENLLAKAIVLPVEENWEATVEGDEDYEHYIQNKINSIEKELGIQTVNEFKRHEYNGQKLEYGKYIVVRKDGKKHIETYNNTGWAYNNNSIKYFYLPKFE